MNLPPLKTGPWKLADLADVPKNGKRVFSCFHCGGGSTMGYKLAGYDVLGGVEIDPEMMAIYRVNHSPKHSFLMGVQEFRNIPDAELPPELFDLDILDGSPPCSSFSMAGSREDGWSENKKFREGQAVQVLDDLFFDYIAIAKKLQPKIVVAENVKGLVLGKARGYVKQIFAEFKEAGYDAQLFLLNAAAMGVPQRRERTFFVARRADLKLPPIALSFDEPSIGVAKAIEGAGGVRNPLSEAFARWWRGTPPGKSFSEAHPKGSFFNCYKMHPGRPANTTIATSASVQSFWNEPTVLSPQEQVRIQSFPEDYNFGGIDAKYVCGMSVPPFMMQRVSREIYRQWLGV